MNERTHNPFGTYKSQQDNDNANNQNEEFGEDFQKKQRNMNDSPNKRSSQQR